MSMLAEAYKKALDYMHGMMQPIGATTNPNDKIGLGKTTGAGTAKSDAAAALQDEDDAASGNTNTAKAK